MLLLLAVACERAPDVTIDPDPFADDTGGGGPSPLGTPCRLDPAPGEAASALRVDDAGVLWHLGQSGLVRRYERHGDCAFQGDVVAGTETFAEVTDLDLDPQGNVWLLVYFSELQRLDAAGTPVLSCEVASGHALAPGGGSVHAWPVGARELAVVEVEADRCAPAPPVAVDVALGTAAALDAGRLAVASHDPDGTLPPGFVLDAAGGSVVAELAADEAFGDESLRVVTDLASDGEAWWVADGVDGNVWALAADGSVRAAWSTRDHLPYGDDDAVLSPQAIAARAGQPVYLAAGGFDDHGVWELFP